MICRTIGQWRQAVIEELGEFCITGCGRAGREVHHLISCGVKRFRLETRNGVPVCRQCHEHSGRARGDEVTGVILPAVKAKCPERWRWYRRHKNEVQGALEKVA